MEGINIPNKIIVHHSASPRDTTTIEMIDAWHKERGFNFSHRHYYVGYHFVILGSGSVVQTRVCEEEGCHTIGKNTSSIGICLTGNFDTEIPSVAQGEALGKLLFELCEKYKISSERIWPHRKFSKTDCFGAGLGDNWAREVWIMWKIDALGKQVEELRARLK